MTASVSTAVMVSPPTSSAPLTRWNHLITHGRQFGGICQKSRVVTISSNQCTLLLPPEGSRQVLSSGIAAEHAESPLGQLPNSEHGCPPQTASARAGFDMTATAPVQLMMCDHLRPRTLLGWSPIHGNRSHRRTRRNRGLDNCAGVLRDKGVQSHPLFVTQS